MKDDHIEKPASDWFSVSHINSEGGQAKSWQVSVFVCVAVIELNIHPYKKQSGLYEAACHISASLFHIPAAGGGGDE